MASLPLTISGAELTSKAAMRVASGTRTDAIRRDFKFPENTEIMAFNYSFHGLRKVATATLAEAGCSPHEIQAITGHSTMAMIEFYSRGARQKVLAESAMNKVEIGFNRAKVTKVGRKK